MKASAALWTGLGVLAILIGLAVVASLIAAFTATPVSHPGSVTVSMTLLHDDGTPLRLER